MSEIVELQTKLDAFKALRDMRLEEQRKVDELKKQETSLQHELLDYLNEHPEVNGVMGSTHKAVMKHSTVPIITDYAVFQQHLIDSGEWDLATQLRPSAPAIRDRWDDKKEIPGIESIQETKLSVTKI